MKTFRKWLFEKDTFEKAAKKVRFFDRLDHAQKVLGGAITGSIKGAALGGVGTLGLAQPSVSAGAGLAAAMTMYGAAAGALHANAKWKHEARRARELGIHAINKEFS